MTPVAVIAPIVLGALSAGLAVALYRSVRKPAAGETHYRALTEASVAGIFRCDTRWHVTYINAAVSRILGLPPERVLGLGWLDAIGEADREDIMATVASQQIVGAELPTDRTVGFALADGSERYGAVGLTPMLDAAGKVTGYSGVMFDITRQEQARAALLASETRFAALAELTPAVIFRTDADLHWTFVNRSWTTLTGKPAATALGRGWTETIHADERDGLLADWAATAATGHAVAREYRIVHADGGVRWISVALAPETDAAGRPSGLVGVMTDVTAQKLVEIGLTEARALAELAATTDELTGLANRRQFMTRLKTEVARGRLASGAMALASIDIDHFKSINDGYGHPRGDIVLRDIGRILRANVRLTDLVGRVGGEEFAVVMPGVDSGSARATCERIRSAVAAHDFGLDATGRRVTVSAGVAALASDESVGSLIDRTDRALYAAKGSGRDRVELAD